MKTFEVWILFKHKYDAVLPIFRTLISLNSKFLAFALPQAATTTNSNTKKKQKIENLFKSLPNNNIFEFH